MARLETLLLVQLLVQTALGEAGPGPSPCQFRDQYTLDCSNRHLTALPRDLPSSIRRLDLSQNDLGALGPGDFSALRDLLHLNLSAAGLTVIDRDAFVGLDNLRTLVLSVNPVLASETFPLQVFARTPNLRTLYVYGVKLYSLEPVRRLLKLEHIMLQGYQTEPETPLELPRLRVVDFVYPDPGVDPKSLLRPFPGPQLQQISLRGYNGTLHNGTFDDFPRLQLLNFACSSDLNISGIIDAISTSEVRVSTLIVDGVQSERPVILGPGDSPECRPAWTNLQHLSARALGTSIFIQPNFTACFRNLETLSAGYIPLVPNIHMSGQRLFHLISSGLSNIRSLDLGFGMQNHIHLYNVVFMCTGQSVWQPENYRYTPPTLPVRRYEERSKDISPATNSKDSSISINSFNPHKFGTSCPKIRYFNASLPRFTYYNGNHVSFGFFRSENCIFVAENNVKYVNLSYMLMARSMTYNFPVFGLDKLEVADLSGLRITGLGRNFKTLTMFPSLKRFYVSDNQLALINFTFPSGLEYLDASHNYLEAIEPHTLDSLSALKTLALADNKLQNLSFLGVTMTSLERLDLRGNKLAYLTESEQLVLDELSRKSNISVMLDHNPLTCGCETIQFIRWFQTTRVTIVDKHKLRCIMPTDGASVELMGVDVTSLRRQCLQLTLILSVSGAATSLVILTSVLLYRYRWPLKWRYYRWRGGRQRAHEGADCPDHRTTYTTCVIVNDGDQTARDWVESRLTPFVEGANLPDVWRPYQSDINRPAIDSYCDAIVESSSALWVITPAFFDRGDFTLREMAVHFALAEFGCRKSFMIILEPDLGKYDQFEEFSAFVWKFKKLGVECLYYSGNTEGQELFWARLGQLL